MAAAQRARQARPDHAPADQLSPPLPHPGSDVDTRSLARGGARRRCGSRPAALLVGRQKRVRYETRSRRIEVPISMGPLAVDEKTLRDDEMQIVFGTRHRDVQKTTLFLQLLGGAGAKVGRNTAIDDVEDE